MWGFQIINVCIIISYNEIYINHSSYDNIDAVQKKIKKNTPAGKNKTSKNNTGLIKPWEI